MPSEQPIRQEAVLYLYSITLFGNLFQQCPTARIRKPVCFFKITRVPRIGNMVVTAFGYQVGQLEYFFRLPAEGFFQFGQILAVHRDDVVKRRRIALADFAAGKA